MYARSAAGKPLAVLDDLKAYRLYSALAGVRDGDHHRTLELVNFIATDVVTGTRRTGWVWSMEQPVGTSLGQGITVVDKSWSGFAAVELPADVQWLGVDGHIQLTLPEALARYDAHLPSLPLTSLVPHDAALVPDGYVPRVSVHILLDGEVRATLELHDAVFGGGAAGQVVFGGGPLRIRVTLSPLAPLVAAPGVRRVEYRGALAVHVEDDFGRVADRSYPVRGYVVTENDTAVAPVGFEIPGASCPSKECDLRTITLPAGSGQPELRVYVHGVFPFDPRG